MAIGKAAVETVKSSGFNTTYTLGSPSRLLCKLSPFPSLYQLVVWFSVLHIRLLDWACLSQLVSLLSSVLVFRFLVTRTFAVTGISYV